MKNTQINNRTKFYIITRDDLTAGQIVAQTNHATSEMWTQFPSDTLEWNTVSKIITVLSVPDEQGLKDLIKKLRCDDIRYSVFIEPDMGNQVTAVAINPADSEITKKHIGHLPLALRESRKKHDVVFHYNKKHNEDQSIPPWVVKYKGESHYVHHLETNGRVKFSTKETPDNSHTKGSLKFKGQLNLNEEDGVVTAYIT